MGERRAHTWSAACVPRLRVSGSVKPHQDKIDVHTTLLIHYVQHRLITHTDGALLLCFLPPCLRYFCYDSVPRAAPL
jgi:hypothetical protein